MKESDFGIEEFQRQEPVITEAMRLQRPLAVREPRDELESDRDDLQNLYSVQTLAATGLDE